MQRQTKQAGGERRDGVIAREKTKTFPGAQLVLTDGKKSAAARRRREEEREQQRSAGSDHVSV